MSLILSEGGEKIAAYEPWGIPIRLFALSGGWGRAEMPGITSGDFMTYECIQVLKADKSYKASKLEIIMNYNWITKENNNSAI